MSRINGDKSRYNRQRKQNIARRERNRALQESMATAGSGDKAKGGTKKASS